MEPVPWKRAGCNFNKKVFFDQQKQEKTVCVIDLTRQHGDERMFIGPLSAKIVFYIPLIPTHRRRCEKSKPDVIVKEEMFHHYRPDLDNYLKLILDVMQNTGVMFQDDGQIAEIYTKKVVSAQPRTHIFIQEMR
jgi:Holliday junction resolvase RusA-like endonuclease